MSKITNEESDTGPCVVKIEVYDDSSLDGREFKTVAEFLHTLREEGLLCDWEVVSRRGYGEIYREVDDGDELVVGEVLVERST